MKNISNIPFSLYQPGKFEHLTKESFSCDIWNLISNPDNLQLMIRATEENKPAIHYLLYTIEAKFGIYLGTQKYPYIDVDVFVNNMIKQLMEHMGYKHIACGICHSAAYIKSSGVYSKQQ